MRRIESSEFKLSILIFIISTFIIPANIKENGLLEVYSFGFPFEYWSIYQQNKGNIWFFDNLFGRNEGMLINVLALFFNVLIIYALLIWLKKTYIKIKLHKKK